MTSSAKFNRRTMLALGGAGLIAGLPLRAAALTSAQAETLVGAAAADINAIIASGAPVETMIAGFKTVFERYSDTAYVAAYALGNDGRAASPAQKAAFADAFATYLADKYGRRFNEFTDGQIAVIGTRPVNSHIEVETRVQFRNDAPLRIDFQVSDRPGRPVFFNMIVEGINMLLSERLEIGAMLDARGGNLDALIADLA